MTIMTPWLWVALGGALGAVLRFMVATLVGVGAQGFPWHTFSVNVAGSFAIGWAWGQWAEAAWFVEWGRYFLVVGVLGGFTTYSAFSLEVMNLLESQKVGLALGLVLSTVFVCLLAVWVGQQLSAGPSRG